MSMQRYAASQFARPSQRSPVKVTGASLSPPGVTIRLSTIRTAKDRADDVLPAMRDDMLAAVPHLRAFAISLCGNRDRADDFVQETLLRALAKSTRSGRGRTCTAGCSRSFATWSGRTIGSDAAKSKTPTVATSLACNRRLSSTAGWSSRKFARRLRSCPPASARSCFSLVRRASPTSRRLRSARSR
jgi:hypothetical protein